MERTKGGYVDLCDRRPPYPRSNRTLVLTQIFASRARKRKRMREKSLRFLALLVAIVVFIRRSDLDRR